MSLTGPPVSKPQLRPDRPHPPPPLFLQCRQLPPVAGIRCAELAGRGGDSQWANGPAAGVRWRFTNTGDRAEPLNYPPEWRPLLDSDPRRVLVNIAETEAQLQPASTVALTSFTYIK